jgi:hypothetical protein
MFLSMVSGHASTYPRRRVTILLVIDTRNPEAIILKTGTLRTRLGVRLHARLLDHALAQGASPHSSAALSLRARALISDRERKRLSRKLRRLLEHARGPHPPLTPGLPICRRKVLRSSGILLQLAERLDDGEPVDARGVAQIQILLNNGEAPVFERPASDDLEPALLAAMDALTVTV